METARAVNADTASAQGADAIHLAFERYRRRFRLLTRRAQDGFEARDWAGIRALTVERLDLRSKRIAATFALLRKQLGERLADKAVWAAMKERYTRAILGRDDFELAQTFFNSLTRKAFAHAGVDPSIDYTSEEFPLPFRGWELASARLYIVRQVDAGVVRRILQDAGFNAPFRDLDGDARLAAERIERGLLEAFRSAEIEALDVLRPVFIRNKGAYVVGRARRGAAVMPVILAIHNEAGGLGVDAVILTEDEASVVFSFARWYFHADVDSPREVIGFLQSILPRKRISELYISLGHNKHGKTEFYRDLMGQIAAKHELFVPAPGQRGLVMAVFTLPSYEFVFKIIRDVFPPSKHTTRRQVMAKYRDVMRHDRVGRLVDFQEFEHLSFARGRFSGPVLDELLRDASRSVWLDGDQVVVKHMYVGRRVTPLDVYLRAAAEGDAEAAVINWGQALKDLAAANIFTGDILLKNFGVTRHGRVVAYDYDELQSLTACNFRRFPPSRDYDDELADEPWFSVAENDVFPQELETFLGLSGHLREIFTAHHGDLLDVPVWHAMQERNHRGEVIDVFPYAETSRLRSPG